MGQSAQGFSRSWWHIKTWSFHRKVVNTFELIILDIKFAPISVWKWEIWLVQDMIILQDCILIILSSHMIRLVETSNPSSPSFLDSKFMDLSWWQSRLGRSTHGLGSNRPDLVGAYLLLHWPKSMQKSISLENHLFMSYSLQILQPIQNMKHMQIWGYFKCQM